MLKKLLTKSLLVAAGLCVGSSAWAYDTPSGYGVSKVFIGTAGATDANGLITTVSSEDFESLASLPSAWSANTINSISIINVTEVDKPAVDAVPTGVPTYVSGKTFRGYLRQGSSNGKRYAQYTLSEIVSSGKLVFSSELFESGQVNGPLILRFLDSSGNPVLTLRQKEKKDGSHTYYSYSIGEGELQEVGTYTLWRTYVGMSIKDLVIDMTTGDASFTMDYIARRKINNNTDYYRTQTTVSGINIGTGKNIASVQIGKDAASSTDLYFYMDNVQLYKLDTYATLYSMVKAEYSTKAANLDASGQTYWVANTTPTITTAAQYKTAVDALPTTYLAAVKAQGAGSDMTDAVENANCETVIDWGAVTAWSSTSDQFHGNTHSTEVTQMSTPFAEAWVNAGTNTSAVLADQTISHTAISGLQAGTYRVTGFIRAASEADHAGDTPAGFSLFANNETSTTSEGISSSAGLVYGTYSVDVTLDGTEDLTFGIKVKDANFNWVAFKNFTLTYLGTDKNTYTINAVAGETTIKELATGSAWASETYGVYVPKVILYNSKYYVLDDNNADVDGFYANYVMGTSDATKEVSYTLDESIVYFEEGESNTVHTTNGNFSNGACSEYRKAGNYNSTSITETGVYRVDICIGDGHSSNSRSFAINTNSGNTYTPIFTVSGTITNTRGTHTKDLLVSAGTTLYTGYSSNTLGVDYIIIRKLPESVSKTISAAGWSTYCSPYILDFTGDIVGLDNAYIVTGATGSVLTMQSVKGKKVPANTGLLLKGTASTAVEIPVASSSDEVSGNQLIGVTSQTELDLSSSKIWVLMVSGSDASFKYTTANTFTLSANSAYLPVNDTFAIPTGNVKALTFFSDDNATAINSVESKKAENGVMYNLAGQRVGKDYKGIVIVNGKKVMNK